MKRLLLLLILLTAPWVYGTTWFATSSSVNIDTANLWVPTQGASCAGSGTALAWGSQANGDTFNANGCTALAINVDPGSVSKQVTLTTDTTNGGGFTLTMANLGTIGTIHAHITATKTTAVAVTGTTSSGTISGNITGGTVAAQVGISAGQTSGTLTIAGTVTGGSAGHGITLTGGSLVINGNVTAGSAASVYGLNGSSTGTATVNGNCLGSDTVYNAGCNGSGSGSITVTGNIINGKRGSGALGNILYTPGSTNYILSPKDASYTLGTIDSHATEMLLPSSSAGCFSASGQ